MGSGWAVLPGTSYVLPGVCALLAFATPATALAELRSFDIPAQEATQAIPEFARQAGLQIVASGKRLRQVRTSAVHGSYDVRAALDLLLHGTGIGIIADHGTIISLGSVRANSKVFALAQPAASRRSGPTKPPAKHTSSAPEMMLKDIVVNARKKSVAERAQDIPMGVSAINGEQIEAAHADDLTDIGSRLANVRLDTIGVFPGIANFAVRGMGFNSSIASTEPTVGLFSDGIYLGINLGSAVDTYDVEVVEVLRGPQGTLFGRNVTGGAVLLRSRRPTGQFGAQVRFGIGNNGRIVESASIENSLTPTLAGKIYAQVNYRDGDFHNIQTGARHDGEHDLFVRPMLRWRPSTMIDVTAIVEHGETRGSGQISRVQNDPNTQTYALGIREPVGVSNLTLNDPGRTDIVWTQVVLDANLDLGVGKLTSITGYRKVAYFSSGDGDGSPLEISRASLGTQQHQFSEELRYAGKAIGGRLDYTFGAYAFEQKVAQTYAFYLFDALATRPKGILNHHAASVFAQGDYELLPRAFLTAGLRYGWERKDVRVARGRDECDAEFNCVYSLADGHSWSNLSPKIGLSWKPRTDILLYASWTKGFRSGGYNTRVTEANESPGPYAPEIARAYEIGLKSEFLHHRLRFNLAAFHNSFSDLQRTVLNPVTLTNRIANAASATIDGFEIEAVVVPTRTLSVSVSAGYLNARYDRFDTLDIDGDGIPDPGKAKGLELIRAPKWTSSASVIWDILLLGERSFIARLTYSYSARSPMNDANTRFVPSYGLFDASISWSCSRGLTVSAWAKNLSDTKYGLTGAATPYFQVIYQSPVRTYGIELVYKY